MRPGEYGYQLVGGRGAAPPTLRVRDGADLSAFPTVGAAARPTSLLRVPVPVGYIAPRFPGSSGDSAQGERALLRFRFRRSRGPGAAGRLRL